MKQRDIFNIVTKRSQQSRQQEQAPEVDEVVEKTKHLKLVGIAWSDSPDAMIEDTKVSRTFFVKRGDMISDVQVEEIYKDKVVLRYRSQTVELK